MDFQVNIKGGEEILRESLQKIVGKASNVAVERGLKNGAEIVKRSMRQRVTKRSRSGNLEKSVTYRVKKEYLTDRAYSAVFGWSDIKVRTNKKGEATSTKDYGPVLEFDEKRRLRHLKIGFDDKQDEAVDAIMREVNKELKI